MAARLSTSAAHGISIKSGDSNRSTGGTRRRAALRLGTILDRLLHHDATLNIKGESYQLKGKRQAGVLERRLKEEVLETTSHAGHPTRSTGDNLLR
jgi:hypothetical protein